MSKLFSAAGTILPLALLLGGCGSESQDLSARDSQALSTLTQNAPAQGQVATWDKHGDGDYDDEDDNDDEDGGDHAPVSVTVSENGKALCTAANVSSRQWSCKVSVKLADGYHVLVATLKRGNSTSPQSNPDRFLVKSSIPAPTPDQGPTPSKG